MGSKTLRRRKKSSVKGTEEPPLFRNSQLTSRFRLASVSSSHRWAERDSLKTSASKGRVSLLEEFNSPRSPFATFSPRRTQSRSTFGLRLQPGTSPSQRLSTNHFEMLDRMVEDLQPTRLVKLRRVLAVCRQKTRQFYEEIHRQVSMSDVEIREEMEHRKHVKQQTQNPSRRWAK